MASSNLSEFVSCPFNRAHSIQRCKLQAHIIKCKRNLPPNHDFVQCQFWALHYVKKSELKAHYETCEHALAKQASFRQSTAEASKFKEPELIFNTSNVQYQCDDDWGVPISQPIVRPADLGANAPYMIIPQGLSKSQRKEYREKERRRLQELEESKKSSKSLETTNLGNFPDQDQLPRKPETSALKHMTVHASSMGSSLQDDVPSSSASLSSEGVNTSQSFSDVPSPRGVASSRSNVQRPSRGRGLLSSWGEENRRSFHPYPYDRVPYHYKEDDFPNL